MTHTDALYADRVRQAATDGQTTDALRDRQHDVLRMVRRHNIYVFAEQFAQHIENIICARSEEKYPLNDDSRRQARARARHAWALLCRFSAPWPVSLPLMGRLLRRDHSTISSGVNRGVTLFERDVSFHTLVMTAENDLREDGWAVGGAAEKIAEYAASRRRKDRTHGKA